MSVSRNHLICLPVRVHTRVLKILLQDDSMLILRNGMPPLCTTTRPTHHHVPHPPIPTSPP